MSSSSQVQQKTKVRLCCGPSTLRYLCCLLCCVGSLLFGVFSRCRGIVVVTVDINVFSQDVKHPTLNYSLPGLLCRLCGMLLAVPTAAALKNQRCGRGWTPLHSSSYGPPLRKLYKLVHRFSSCDLCCLSSELPQVAQPSAVRRSSRPKQRSVSVLRRRTDAPLLEILEDRECFAQPSLSKKEWTALHAAAVKGHTEVSRCKDSSSSVALPKCCATFLWPCVMCCKVLQTLLPHCSTEVILALDRHGCSARDLAKDLT